VDFQLFLITPFFLYAYSRNKKVGWMVTGALFLASVLTAFVQIMVNEWRYPVYNPNFPPQPDFMDKFYYKPWIRASAYMMGVFSGFIYVEWKNGDPTVTRIVGKIKNSIIIRVLFYLVGITLCEGTIWIIVSYQTGGEWSTTAQAFYNSLNRYTLDNKGSSSYWACTSASSRRCSAAETTPPSSSSATGSSLPSPRSPSASTSRTSSSS